MKNQKTLTPNEVLGLLGNPGKFSWIVLLLCFLGNPIASFNHLAMSIWGATPPHRCRLPDGVAPNNLSIPEKDGKLDSCSVYVAGRPDPVQTVGSILYQTGNLQWLMRFVIAVLILEPFQNFKANLGNYT